MLLRPSQFNPLLTKKTVESGHEKVPLFEYEEPSHKFEYALMEATLHGDRGSIHVRLHNGVHFSYIKGELVVKIDRHAYSGMFNALLYCYDIAYVTEATYGKYLEDIKNPYFKKDRHDETNDSWIRALS